MSIWLIIKTSKTSFNKDQPRTLFKLLLKLVFKQVLNRLGWFLTGFEIGFELIRLFLTGFNWFFIEFSGEGGFQEKAIPPLNLVLNSTHYLTTPLRGW